MFNAHDVLIGRASPAAALAAAAARRRPARPRTSRSPIPTSVVMIVNRDSNDIAFMDIKTKKMVGKTFLGQQRQPAHGDDVARRPLRRHRRHARQQGVHHRRAHAAARQGDPRRHRAGASGVLAGQPLVLPGQSGRRLDLGHRHDVADARSRRFPGSSSRSTSRSCRTARRRTSATTARTGSASSTSGGTSC